MALGVPAGDCELEKEAGDEESLRRLLPVLVRVDVRDFRRPWADEGRPGEAVLLPGEEKPAGGSDWVHSFPASSASSYKRW